MRHDSLDSLLFPVSKLTSNRTANGKENNVDEGRVKKRGDHRKIHIECKFMSDAWRLQRLSLLQWRQFTQISLQKEKGEWKKVCLLSTSMSATSWTCSKKTWLCVSKKKWLESRHSIRPMIELIIFSRIIIQTTAADSSLCWCCLKSHDQRQKYIIEYSVSHDIQFTVRGDA